ncbi:mitochondrial carrier domain-containing protein [Dactylonectria estremocensis]|uniref:Mitochondrial carrier domain-containing protein n=1 Tax=Dactylonectria estremocensis TaxID=1079267 RepID=A0A9P9J9J4_9HYPO|nr:mitochondrial carrier domain-containing protein [Dactylonectria estremocensis]
MTTDLRSQGNPSMEEPPKQVKRGGGHDYKGFVAGVFSGIAKLTVGHPFDTIKVRMQTTDASRFSGPLQCLTQTVRNEGFVGLYKGATPPLVGWMFMDSVMLGSLNVYRRLLSEHVFHVQPASARGPGVRTYLPAYGHGMAGIMAGCTVSFIAAPVEHVKARLQIQYAAHKADRLYAGPIDALRKIYRHHGIRGVYHGLSATLLFRGFFFCWWGSYDLFSRFFRSNTGLSAPAINFWAGGLSAQVFWLTSYPSDVVKQRIMTDPLGGGLSDGVRKFPRWKDAAVAVYKETGWRGYWRGFVPCFLRAFPANAMALVAFEGVMRSLP